MIADALQRELSQAGNDYSESEPDYAGIVSLLKLAREQTSLADLGFVMVNQTHNLAPYFQAFAWTASQHSSVRVAAASGVSELDRHTPVVQYLEGFIARLRKSSNARKPVHLDLDSFGDHERSEWLPQYGLWCPYESEQSGAGNGMLFTNDRPFTPGESENLIAVADGYGHAWYTLSNLRRQTPGSLASRFVKPRWLLFSALLLAALALVPVRFSVLAAARVVAVDPVIVASPIDGVIDRVVVKPNQAIKAGDLLVEFNSTQARTDYELAESDYRIAVADYELAVQRSFTDTASKAQRETLSLLVDEKRLAVDFARMILDQTRLYAEAEGIALFIGASQWRGRPVSTGERIMTIADPAVVEIDIQLPPDDGGAVAQNATVDFFLDTDPNNPLDAAVSEIAFEAELSETGELVYPITAQIAPDQHHPRLGLKGTAKIYGERVSLFYYLFRKPWSALRQLLSF